SARWVRSLDFSELKILGIVMKRAKYFITCNGRYYGDVPFSASNIRFRLSPKQDLNLRELEKNSFEQLSFLDASSRHLIGAAVTTSMTGEF
ncbi:MAG TPA: biotin synthase, partial [Clostridiaceae bacterium]|nr:biotin synthase [Clostridiaceae bacterium]